MTISASVSGEVHDRVGQIESLITELDALPDPAARAVATEALQAVLELHGVALDRMLELVAEAGEQGSALLASFAGDDRVGNVLMLHGLHPVDIRTRVAQALDSVRPYLESHGGDVELLGVDDGVVRLRLEGSCKGCPSSAATLKTAIEEAIMAAAPDVLEITAEGVTPPPAPRPLNALVPLPMMGAMGAPAPSPVQPPAVAGGPSPSRATWSRLAEAPPVVPGEARRLVVDGVAILLCRLQGRLYAYRTPCPGCGDPLESVWVAAGNLVCPGCSRAYDVRGAGRCTQDDSTRLEPLPLLEEAGGIRVAIPAGTR
jgi:Fe-S cluster biogenesis protein NfuA/nitrite reductase/ring-hydroxylating ferredoxin subunit